MSPLIFLSQIALMLAPALLDLYWIWINDPVQETKYLRGRSDWQIQTELQQRGVSYLSLGDMYRQHNNAFIVARIMMFFFIVLMNIRPGMPSYEEKVAFGIFILNLIVLVLKLIEWWAAGHRAESENEVPMHYSRLHGYRQRYALVHQSLVCLTVVIVIYVCGKTFEFYQLYAASVVW